MRTSIYALRRRAAVATAVVAVTMTAAACGSSSTSDDDASDTTAKSTTTTVGTLSTDQLNAALLTVADMPPGFVVQPPSEGDAGPQTTVCPNGAEILKQELHDSSSVEFSESETGPIVTQVLSSAPDAEEHFADLKNALDSCVGETWTEDLDGLPATLSLEEVSTVDVGDEAVAYRLTGSSDDGTISLSGDMVYLRNASVVENYIGLSLTQLADPASGAVMFPDVLTAEEFASIIEAGNARVTDVIGA